MSSESDVLRKFRSLDGPVTTALSSIESPLKLGLAALLIAHDSSQDRMTIHEVHAALEAADIPVDRTALGRAFSRAGRRVTRKKLGSRVFYRLTIRGREEAADLLRSGGLEAIYVEGDKPRSDRREFGALLSGLDGSVRISDPYFGIRTLDTLESLPQSARVRFLTAQVSGNREHLERQLKDFSVERPGIEVRRAAAPRDLHDRYVLSDGQLMLVGHGLKDIGARESFVVVIPRKFAPDMHSSVRTTFDSRWSKAKQL